MHPENFHLIFSQLNKVRLKENSIVSLIPLPKYELNKDNMDILKWRKSQSNRKNYSQLENAETRRNCLLQIGTH